MSGMATDTRIGTSIKRARERKRWTQRQLAAALGVDRKTVDNWENGRTSPRSSIGALEEVLGLSLDSTQDEPESEWDRWERETLENPAFRDNPDLARAIVTDARAARDAHLAAGQASPSDRSRSRAQAG